MKAVTLLLFLFNFSCILFAQEPTVLKGIVINKDNFTLAGANILLYSKKDTNNILEYSISNKSGAFSLATQEDTDVYMEVSYLGYEPKKIPIQKELNYYTIILSELPYNLEEVELTASKYIDTIRLKNDTLKFSKNSKLKDVLKDNPGIEITDDNGLKFMGVPINKILINKKEVFVNQNSLALENITNEMIENLQIINNYQDKFNVGFDNFSEMVLNVDVKNKFKGLVKNTLELGAGAKNSYSIKGLSFLFSDKVNVFLTQNSNSIFDKSNNQTEMVTRQTNSSTFYKENVKSIATGFENVSEDFYNNTRLLIKKENKKSKIETNIGFNYSKQALNTTILIDDAENTISEENAQNKRKGKAFYADFGLISLISDVFSIRLFSKVDFIENDLVWKNDKTIFPSSTFHSNTFYESNNSIITNGLSSKSILNQNWLLENSAEYILENTTNEFYLDLSDVRQNVEYNNKRLNTVSSIFYQKSNLLNFGLSFVFSNATEDLSSKINTNRILLKRTLKQLKSSLILKGQNQKWNYFVNVGTQFFLFQNNQTTRATLPVSSSLNYKFSNNKSLSISFENTNEVEPIENSLDSLFVNSTTLITSNEFLDNSTQRQNGIVSYTISNISKSKNISFLVAVSKDSNFSQNSIVNFNSTSNQFQKNIFDQRKTLFVKQDYSKGFYFSENDHKIQFGYTVSSTFFEGEVIQRSIIKPIYSEQFALGLNISVIPQQMFFTELVLNGDYTKSDIRINSLEINSINTTKKAIALIKSDGNYSYSIEFYSQRYQTENELIATNDIKISYRYYINTNTSVFLRGINILNVLNLNNNAGDLKSNAINGVNTTTIDTNTFGYLIMGIQFKI